jgi:guanylate kinase
MGEINRLKEKGADLSHTITNLIRRKLDRRARDPPEKRKNRASGACKEMQYAHSYAHVIPNHDGEDSDNWGLPHCKDDDWTLPYPIGDARKTLETFVELLEKGDSNLTEHWPKDLL